MRLKSTINCSREQYPSMTWLPTEGSSAPLVKAVPGYSKECKEEKERRKRNREEGRFSSTEDTPLAMCELGSLVLETEHLNNAHKQHLCWHGYKHRTVRIG